MKNLVAMGTTFKINSKSYVIVGFGRQFRYEVQYGKTIVKISRKKLFDKLKLLGSEISLQKGFKFVNNNIECEILGYEPVETWLIQSLYDSGTRSTIFKDELEDKLNNHKSENINIFGK